MSRRACIIVGLALVVTTAALAAEPERSTGRIKGTVAAKGGVSSETVAFFDLLTGPPPDPARYFRIPDEVIFTDPLGSFSVELPVGKYYVAALGRKGSKRMGPPDEGDFVYLPRDAQGRLNIYVVTAKETTDIGSLDGAVAYAAPSPREPSTRIEGIITGKDGKPAEGVFAVASRVPNLSARPLFVSLATGKDGRYSLRVHPGGRYFLRVRATFGEGPPERGALLGTYGGGSPKPVDVERGQVVGGKDMLVEPFAGRGNVSSGGKDRPKGAGGDAMRPPKQ